MQILDYSFARPDIRTIAASGYVGVARYLAYLSGPSAPKVITAGELFNLRAAGLSVVFVWEVGTDWTTWNGAEADRQLDALGVSGDTPVYWAVDRDILQGSYDLVGQMLDGVNSRRPRGIYSEADCVRHCLDSGQARFGWISSAYGWSGAGNATQAKAKAPGAHLCQLIGSPIPGTDVNDCMKPDWGQWPRPQEDDLTAEEHAWLQSVAAWCMNITNAIQVQTANNITDPNVGVLKRLADVEAKLDALTPPSGGLSGDIPFTGTIHAG